MTEFRVEGADEIAARLRRFRVTTIFTETVDTVQPTLVAALRLAAPRKTGRLADRIRAHRETSATSVDLVSTTDVPYAPYVLRGTRAHSIAARNAQALRWYDQGGEAVFATSVQHPGTKANPFPRRTWEGLRGAVLGELVARIREGLAE